MSPRTTAALSFLAAATLVGTSAQAAESEDVLFTLEAMEVATAGHVSAALPLRFALFADGQVFVGGTSRLLAGRLTKEETSALERRANELRKLPGLAATVSLGPGPAGFRLRLKKGKPLDVLVQGDPAAAPPGLGPLASLIADLLRFDHVSLQPYEPDSYALVAHEGTLVGGCRPWALPASLAEAIAGPVVLPAAVVSDWPTGATPASVCSGDKAYVVTLRPLLPGETP
jgi:hypothetical protein